MAQLSKTSVLAKRFGLKTSPLRMLILAGICVVLGLVGVSSRCSSSSITIARGDASLDGGEEALSEDEASSNAEAQEKSHSLESAEAQDHPERILVHVDGAVETPGLVTVECTDPRVADAIEAAGGLRSEADTVALNLASKLVDGQKIHVPCEGEQAAAPAQSPDASRTLSQTGVEPRINLNTADAAQLQSLPGIGEATAAEILRDRELNGSFSCVEDLMRVSGIGEKKFAKIEDYVTV